MWQNSFAKFKQRINQPEFPFNVRIQTLKVSPRSNPEIKVNMAAQLNIMHEGFLIAVTTKQPYNNVIYNPFVKHASSVFLQLAPFYKMAASCLFKFVTEMLSS